MAAVEKDQQRKREQAAKGLDSLTYFVLCKLTDEGIPNPDVVSRKVSEAFAEFPNWRHGEAELRELRKKVTFAVFAEEDDLEKVTSTVEAGTRRLCDCLRAAALLGSEPPEVVEKPHAGALGGLQRARSAATAAVVVKEGGPLNSESRPFALH